jgi:hypothetical protein
MLIKEKKSVEIFKNVSITCDICGTNSGSMEAAELWLTVVYGHSDWGIKSGDSVERLAVCCVECYLIAMQNAIKELEGHRTGYVNDMKTKFGIELLKKIKESEAKLDRVLKKVEDSLLGTFNDEFRNSVLNDLRNA